jgi:hypothetical protein
MKLGEEARVNLVKARELIESCGYHRHKNLPSSKPRSPANADSPICRGESEARSRRFHVHFDPLYRPGAETERLGDLEDPLLKLPLHLALKGSIDLWPPKLRTIRHRAF